MPGPGSNSYKLLGIIQSHAPSGTGQQMAAEAYWDAERTWNGDEEAMEKEMALILTTGLRYGNWPWNIAAKGKSHERSDHPDTV